MNVSGGKAGSTISDGVRTPLRVALEARLALALCLPLMGAVYASISKRGTRMNSNCRAIVKFVASMTVRIFGLVDITDAGEVATNRNS